MGCCACATSRRTTRISSAPRTRSPRNACELNEQMLSIYRDFGFTDVRIKFSDRPDKRVGSDEVWDKAEAALEARGRGSRPRLMSSIRARAPSTGPKLEYVLRDAIGRDWQCGTIQVDLNLPGRLGAFYIGPGRREDRAGDDPPRHVRLARALHRHSDRALCRASAAVARAGAGDGRHHRVRRRRLCRRGADGAAKAAGLRAEADLRNEKINYKVREHSLAKVPVLLVVGKREAEERTVSVRRLGSQEQQVMTLDAAVEMLAGRGRAARSARGWAAAKTKTCFPHALSCPRKRASRTPALASQPSAVVTGSPGQAGR